MLCKWDATISCNYRHRYASKPLHIYNFISSVTNYINFHPYIILNDRYYIRYLDQLELST